MTYPTPRTIEAALAALQSESALWTSQSDRLQLVANQANALRIEPGASVLNLDDFLAAYNNIARKYTDLCTGGRDATAGISRALDAVRTTYETEERANLHAHRRLY